MVASFSKCLSHFILILCTHASIEFGDPRAKDECLSTLKSSFGKELVFTATLDSKLRKQREHDHSKLPTNKKFAHILTTEDYLRLTSLYARKFSNDESSFKSWINSEHFRHSAYAERGKAVECCENTYNVENRYLTQFKIADEGRALWVEIPKCASSTIKSLLSEIKTLPNHLLVPILPTFIVARHPLSRYLSGFGTVRSRSKKMYLKGALYKPGNFPFNQGWTQGKEFCIFSKHFIRNGDDFLRLREDLLLEEHYAGNSSLSDVSISSTVASCRADYKQANCVIWMHLLSQMRFIETSDAAIDMVLHVESLDEDIVELSSILSLNLSSMTDAKAANVGEGSINTREIIEYAESHCPQTLRSIELYFSQDSNCLGYNNTFSSIILS